jgi:SAM-dependent methyltransferase
MSVGRDKLGWRDSVSPTSSHYWYRKGREVERLLTGHVQLPADAQIVDFGAGRGGDVVLLASIYPSSRILALELNREAVTALRERFGDLPAVTVESADLRERLPLEDTTVDLGHCSEVLEHIPDPQTLLTEAHRVIKPNGSFLVTTPNQPNAFQRKFWLERKGRKSVDGFDPARSAAGVRQDLDLYGHISLGTIRQWDAALAQAGFELVDFGRGAITYGSRRWLDREGTLAGFFAAEALIDLAPRRLSRPLSDQHIGLYRRL